MVNLESIDLKYGNILETFTPTNEGINKKIKNVIVIFGSKSSMRSFISVANKKEIGVCFAFWQMSCSIKSLIRKENSQLKYSKLFTALNDELNVD